MANNTSGYNITFPIYDANGQPFNNLVLKKSVVDTTVMSLGDKISGDIFWNGSPLVFTMNEYVLYNDVKYVLVNPPTIIHEGLVDNNSELKGMVKYSFEFYHPMYILNNIPFTDVATKEDEEYYLSQDKTFSWMGTFFDFKDKLNANLRDTRWHVVTSNDSTSLEKMAILSDVLSFDKNTVAEAMKKAYETWDVPYTIEDLPPLPDGYELYEYLQIIELTQVVTNETAPLWLFLRNMPSVVTDGKIYQCKIFDDDTLMHHLYPCRRETSTQGIYRIGMYDIITNTFFDTHGQGRFTVGGDMLRDYDFAIIFGTPTTQIYDKEGNQYVFRMGQGLGLKNNSRTPRNNKIITRLAGYGSEDNIPYGYPQIIWTGNQSWDYTINNAPGMQDIEIGGVEREAMSYPIYDGIVNGQNVRLIKHPFTRTHLMPSIYSSCVNRKVNPLATNYDPDIKLVDYYDADDSTIYPNTIVLSSPSYEVREYDVKPQLGNEKTIVSAQPQSLSYITYSHFSTIILGLVPQTSIQQERRVLLDILKNVTSGRVISQNGGTRPYLYTYSLVLDGSRMTISYTSTSQFVDNFTYIVDYNASSDYVVSQWDDSVDDNGVVLQSNFYITLPSLGFDLYACAAITQEMTIAMRSGDCIGCSFPVQVDWEDYKKNFYNDDGEFDPVPHTTSGDGHVRDATKYPDSTNQSITLLVAKDNTTFGRLMPNIYQQPKTGDHFTILGISLPQLYVTNAELALDDMIEDDMLQNNVFYYDYPLVFDELFLATHVDILEQIKTNTVIQFMFQGDVLSLYVKQITKKFGYAPLPQYDIVLTDNIEVVLNAIGSVEVEIGRIKEQQVANEQRFTTTIALETGAVHWNTIIDAPSYLPQTDTLSVTNLEATNISINGVDIGTVYHPYGGSSSIPFKASQMTSMGGVTAYATTTDDTESLLDGISIDSTLRKVNDVLGLSRGQSEQILKMVGSTPTWVDTVLRFMKENQDGSVGFDTDVTIGDDSDTYGLVVSGSVTASQYITSSDKRKKTPIKDISLSLDDILSLSLVLFTYKNDKNKKEHVGTYAQEVKKILPQAVYTLNDGSLALDYGILATALVISLAREVKKIKDNTKQDN